MANELAISANPMRMAQFSYNLVASVISGIIPLSIRLTKNRNDVDAGREMLAMLNNKLYQARDAYYASITLGMVQVGVHFLPLIFYNCHSIMFPLLSRGAMASRSCWDTPTPGLCCFASSARRPLS